MKTKLAGALVLIIAVLAVAACGGGSDSSTTGDVAAFCDKAAAIKQETTSGDLQVAPGDVEGAKTVMQKLADDMQGAADVAPPEIKDSMNTAVDAFQKINTGVQDANTAADFQALAPELQTMQQTLQSVNKDVNAYVQKNCPDATG
jgi:hypothetical protein